MRHELENSLYEKYPELFKNHVLPISVSCMGLGIDIGDGWYDLLDKLCTNLMNYCNRTGKIIPAFDQIKQKFGLVCIYLTPYTVELDEYIAQAVAQSLAICELCGKVGQLRLENGWMSCRCKSCLKKKRKNETHTN